MRWSSRVALWGLTAVSLPADLAAQHAVLGRDASVRIGGRMHTQYATTSVDTRRGQFLLRRARIEADITVNGFIDARIQPEFAAGGAELKDAFIRLTFSPALQVTMGQFKRPFDLFELSSSADLSLVERDGRIAGVDECGAVGGTCSYSRLTEKLSYADRDIGVRVGGARGKATYEVSLTNGSGANVADENGSKSLSGRISLEATPDFTVSGNFALHDYLDASESDAHTGAWGADAQYGTWRDGLLVLASAVGGGNWKKLDIGGEPASFMAFQGTASWYFPLEGARFAGIEPLVRLSIADPDTDTRGDGGCVLTPGLMMYVSGRSKIGANLDLWAPQNGQAQHSVKLQTYLYF